NSACDELEGKPRYQVSRFHTMAPIRPPKITAGVILVSSTRPLEIVLATATDRNAPTRPGAPEIATAALGWRARVASEVAMPVAIDVVMALAVSWKPLVKSNARAVMITTRTITSISPLSSREVDGWSLADQPKRSVNGKCPVGSDRQVALLLRLGRRRGGRSW